MFTVVFCIENPKVPYRGILQMVRFSHGEVKWSAPTGLRRRSVTDESTPWAALMALQTCLPIFPFYFYLTERASLVGGTVKASRDSLSKCSLYESMWWKGSSQLHRNSYNQILTNNFISEDRIVTGYVRCLKCTWNTLISITTRK